MRYSKFLIMSASIFTATLSYAACTGSNCFNQGVDFANQAKPSSDSISNSVLESAVGANNIAKAQATQDSIQSTMGNDYKNIDGITNSGKNKAQACVGKDTTECKAYNYYNDPLTKLSQQGIESAVGVASNLINKKIQQNVNITDYCAQNPNDSICKMCKQDPSQSMCQNGNKCTTISYTTGDNKYVSNGCQIIGQRSYDCEKWVDNVQFHNDYTPPSPPDGTPVGTGTTSAGGCGGAYASINMTMTAYATATKQDSVVLTGYVSGSAACAKTVRQDFNMLIPFSGYNSQIYAKQDWPCGNSGDHWFIGNYVTVSGGCNGNNCSYILTVRATHGGESNQCKTDQSSSLTFNFQKPQSEKNQIVVDKVVWKDTCNQ